MPSNALVICGRLKTDLLHGHLRLRADVLLRVAHASRVFVLWDGPHWCRSSSHVPRAHRLRSWRMDKEEW